MSTTDEIMALVNELPAWRRPEVRAAIEARVAALVAERDKARAVSGYDWDLLEATQSSLREHMQRIAVLEAENQALLTLGEALAGCVDRDAIITDEESAAYRVFEGQPGALESWLGKGVG